VLDLLARHEATWTPRPPVVAAVGALRAAHDEATDADRERAALATEGLTADKDAQRDRMEAATMRLVLALRPYARASDDGTLLAAVDVSASRLARVGDAAATAWAVRVAEAATAHLDALAGYGVTRADVTALEEATEAFAPMRAARDATAGQREARTEALRPALARARRAVRLLDDLVPGLGDAELAAEYRRVRRTDDR
jgi:hypothetical protein